MDFIIEMARRSGPGDGPFEVVERKGRGHPDTICDAVAEEVSLALCGAYEERFGAVLHHNVDKVLLCGGSAAARFGGGQVRAPIEIILGGRATSEHRGAKLAVDEIAADACRAWVSRNLPHIDPRHLVVTSRIRPGSADLGALFSRGASGGVPRSNDTSCGVGFAPRTALEEVVLRSEEHLNDPRTKRDHPYVGEDVKIMGVRHGDRIDLTVACAMVSRFVHDLDDYAMKVEIVRGLVAGEAARVAGREVGVTVNAADDLDRGEVYLTVTGTSAEAGDDGEVGRGNRVSGLITPYRPMTMEAAAGKNPVSHVGKLYNVLAARIAAAIAAEVETVTDATCVLLSRIGHPIDDPRAAHVRLSVASGVDEEATRRTAEAVVAAELASLGEVRRDLLERRLRLY